MVLPVSGSSVKIPSVLISRAVGGISRTWLRFNFWNFIHRISKVMISHSEGRGTLVVNRDKVAIEKCLSVFLDAPAQIRVVSLFFKSLLQSLFLKV